MYYALINHCFSAMGLQKLLIYVCLHPSPEDLFSYCWYSCLKVCSFKLGCEQMHSSCTRYYRSFCYYAVSCCLAVSCAAKYTHKKSVWSSQQTIKITKKLKKRGLNPTAWTPITFVWCMSTRTSVSKPGHPSSSASTNCEFYFLKQSRGEICI